MANSSGRRTASRIVAGIGAVAAGSLILPGGIAHAEPTKEEVKKKISDLQEDAGKIVDDYNAAKEDYDTAKKKYDGLDKQVGDEEERYNKLREKVAGFASANYRAGELDSPTRVLAAKSPDELLGKSADLGYLSDNQKTQLDEFEGSTERLIKLKKESKDALKDTKGEKDKIEKKKDKVEDKIDKQEDLLAEFPDADPSSGGNDSGQSYGGSASGNAKAALDYAYSQLGKPYVYGGTGPNGFDCSGLTMRAWGAAGVSLPRTTYAQAGVGQSVSRDALQPGDLLFFSGNGHMGMYVGGGQMIHAPRTGKNVEVVSLSGYWDGQYVSAQRP